MEVSFGRTRPDPADGMVGGAALRPEHATTVIA